MELQALVNTSHRESITVGTADLAVTVKSGDLPVLATPRMVALMEQAAAALLCPHLADGITTVGTALHIAHTAPTAAGRTVTAEATLVETDGRRFVFAVAAFDDAGEIGRGTHERVSVKSDRFLEKAAARGQEV
ncbi:MAG: thioesterase family protein [Clostridia bacterium]|nr:thioesterase family protein [Clostridia bacterium]